MRGPVGWVIEQLGGLAIDRNQNKDAGNRVSYTDRMAGILRANDKIAMIVTPEGTRKARDEWKLGFYYAAQRASCSICVGICDYRTKHIGVPYCYRPSGDLDADLTRMMQTYGAVTGKNPTGFLLDKRYS